MDISIETIRSSLCCYEEQLKFFCNWIPTAKYIDQGDLGFKIKTRPAFLKMMDDAKRGKFNIIVTKDVCQLSKSAVEALDLIQELKNYKIDVYFMDEKIYTRSTEGLLRLCTMASMAKHKRQKMSECVRAGLMKKRKMGDIDGN